MARSRSTLVLLTIILVLGAFIWIQQLWRSNVQPKEIRRVRLFDLDPDTLASIQFRHTNLLVDCVNANGIWMTGGTERGLGRADVAMVHKMVAGLNAIGKGTTITAEHLKVRGLDASEYGFKAPTVEITAIDNKGQHRWLIGRETPLGDMLYIKQDGEDEIYTVSNELLSIIPDKPDTLRDRTLFSGRIPGVQRIEIRGSGGFIQVLKDAKSKWQIQQPLVAAADAQEVEQLLAKLVQLRIEEFLFENVSDFSVYGLQGETRQISLGGLDGASRMLVIGDPIADQSGYVYARRADDTGVFSLKDDVLDLLDIKANDLRDASVLSLPVSDIDYISVVRNTDKLELVSDESGKWMVTKPVRWDADRYAVAEFLKLWDAAVITEFDSTNAAVSPAEWTLQFGSSDLSVTNHIQILPALGKKDGLYIMRKGEVSVCQINLPIIPESILDPLEFKNRRIWQLRQGDIQKIAIEKPAQGRQVLEQRPGGEFEPVETNGMVVVDYPVLERLLHELYDLSAVDYVAYIPRDISIYGLAEPSLTLQLGLAGTNQLGRVLLVGEEAAQGYYAMVKGRDVVFILDESFVELLTADLVVTRDEIAPNSE